MKQALCPQLLELSDDELEQEKAKFLKRVEIQEGHKVAKWGKNKGLLGGTYTREQVAYMLFYDKTLPRRTTIKSTCRTKGCIEHLYRVPSRDDEEKCIFLANNRTYLMYVTAHPFVWNVPLRSLRCWLYQPQFTDSEGYGRLPNGKRLHLASFELYRGERYGTMQLNHICGNKNCYNPYHLYQGTQGENVRDTIEQGRYNNGYRAGSAHPFALLSYQQVWEAKKDHRRHAKKAGIIAQNLGVSGAVVRGFLKPPKPDFQNPGRTYGNVYYDYQDCGNCLPFGNCIQRVCALGPGTRRQRIGDKFKFGDLVEFNHSIYMVVDADSTEVVLTSSKGEKETVMRDSIKFSSNHCYEALKSFVYLFHNYQDEVVIAKTNRPWPRNESKPGNRQGPRLTMAQKKTLLIKQNYKCAGCPVTLTLTTAEEYGNATVDRITPGSQGGTYEDIGNCQLLCRRCNQERQDKDWVSWKGDQ